jgi:hypothetical protein
MSSPWKISSINLSGVYNMHWKKGGLDVLKELKDSFLFDNKMNLAKEDVDKYIFNKTFIV